MATDTESTINACVTNIGDLQNLTVNFTDEKLNDKSEQKNIILVCDTSGSMHGTPKNQVIEVVETLAQEKFDFTVVQYSNFATVTEPLQLKKVWQGGITNFRYAFETTINLIKSDTKYSMNDTDIVFLTDGHPSDNPLSDYHQKNGLSFQQFKTQIQNHVKNVTVHVFGLGTSHNVEILQTIQNSGKISGVYSYADPTKSATDINNELGTALAFAKGTFTANLLFMQCDEVLVQKKEIDLSTNEDGIISGNIWLNKLTDKDILSKTTSIILQLDDIKKVIPMINVNKVEPTKMNYLSYISVQITDLCKNWSSDPVAIAEKIKELEKLQDEIDNLKLVKMGKMEKKLFLNELMNIQTEIDTVRRLFVDISESRVNANEILARLNAMKYRGRLNKARRQRKMDQRSLKNTEMVIGISKDLEKLCLTDDDLQIEADAVSDLVDNISQLTLKEILTDPECKHDILCMGVVAKRNETAIDCPTCIRVFMKDENGTPCITMFSWDTFETAATFEMNRASKNQEQTTGNFDFESISRVLVGQGREGVNACLPVYGCEGQYRRARLLLPVLCGYLFTLSDTGYDPSQINALYAILARLTKSMKDIHNQKKAGVSERSLFMLNQFRLFCGRLLVDTEIFDILKVPQKLRPMDVLQRFTTELTSHQKSELPTLDIFYGILLAAQGNEQVEKKLADYVDPCSLSRIILTEAVRRYMNMKADQEKSGSKIFWNAILPIIYPSARTTTHYDAAVTVKSNCTLYGDDKRRFRQTKFDDYVEAELDTFFTTQMNVQTLFEFVVDYMKVKFDLKASSVNEISQSMGCIGLNIPDDMFKNILPIIVVQAMWACGNDIYTTFIEKGLAILDPISVDSQHKILKYCHDYFNEMRKRRWGVKREQLLNKLHAQYAIFSTKTIPDFVQVLKGLRIGRGHVVWDNMVQHMFPSDDRTSEISMYREKIAVMLRGKYFNEKTKEEEVIIPGGWMAGHEIGTRIRSLLAGDMNWIIEEMDKMVLMHQYRSSGLKNRHGHNNDNPLWIAKPNDRNVNSLVKKWDL